MLGEPTEETEYTCILCSILTGSSLVIFSSEDEECVRVVIIFNTLLNLSSLTSIMNPEISPIIWRLQRSKLTRILAVRYLGLIACYLGNKASSGTMLFFNSILNPVLSIICNGVDPVNLAVCQSSPLKELRICVSDEKSEDECTYV